MGISLSFLNQLTPYSIILKRNKIILHHSLQSTMRERGEGRGKFLYFSIMSFMQWFRGDIKITIISVIYFLE